MHHLWLEVHRKSDFKAKMANNVSVKCLGVYKGVKVTVCGVKVAVDMYVIPAKGEGYPIILGRPWLIAMSARQDWVKGTLVLNPPGQSSGKAIVYNLREGTQAILEVETSEESEFSSSSSSSVDGETSQSNSEYDSSLEICGVTLREPSECVGGCSRKELKDEDLEKMIAKDLSTKERESFKVMLRKHPSLFISDYSKILGVTAIQNQINLKPNMKPVLQRLRHIGKIQISLAN